MSRRTRRGSASDTSQQEGEPPADEVGEGGAADATAVILAKFEELYSSYQQCAAQLIWAFPLLLRVSYL